MSSPKTALICGISGQDGAYLARLLLEKGYTVYGTSRDAQFSSEVVGLDWRKHVELDEGLFRPTDIAVSRVNPAKANRVLGWEAKSGVKEIIRGMMDLEEKQRSAVL